MLRHGWVLQTAPGSPKKKAGFSGTALPTSVDSEHLEIDSGVATINQSVADDGMIEADDDSEAYAAQLALVDPATNSDKCEGRLCHSKCSTARPPTYRHQCHS